MAERWEYKEIAIPEDECIGLDQLQTLGYQGWELCTLEVLEVERCYLFKRRLPPHVPKWHRFTGEDLAA